MLSACAPAAPRPVTSRAIVFARVARSSDAARRGPPHGRGRGNRSGFLETPHTRFVGVFLASTQTASQFVVSRHAWVASDAGQRLWLSITGSSSRDA